MRDTLDSRAARAVLVALNRDGWSNRGNTRAPVRALRRVYRELLDAGLVRFDVRASRYVRA